MSALPQPAWLLLLRPALRQAVRPSLGASGSEQRASCSQRRAPAHARATRVSPTALSCLPHARPLQGLGRSTEEKQRAERARALERLEQKRQALQVGGAGIAMLTSLILGGPHPTQTPNPASSPTPPPNPSSRPPSRRSSAACPRSANPLSLPPRPTPPHLTPTTHSPCTHPPQDAVLKAHCLCNLALRNRDAPLPVLLQMQVGLVWRVWPGRGAAPSSAAQQPGRLPASVLPGVHAAQPARCACALGPFLPRPCHLLEPPSRAASPHVSPGPADSISGRQLQAGPPLLHAGHGAACAQPPQAALHAGTGGCMHAAHGRMASCRADMWP